MAYCPHCNVRYDETNETQPCCYRCGHPISCGCGGGHQHTPPSSSVPPEVRAELRDQAESGGDTERSADNSADAETGNHSPDLDELPF